MKKYTLGILLSVGVFASAPVSNLRAMLCVEDPLDNMEMESPASEKRASCLTPALVCQQGCPFGAMVSYLRENPQELDSLLFAWEKISPVGYEKADLEALVRAFIKHFSVNGSDRHILDRATSPHAKKIKRLVSPCPVS